MAWPGENLSGVLAVDPFLALSSWLEVRGDTEGYLFCNMAGEGERQRMLHHEHWPNNEFVAFMRRSLVVIGIAPARANLCTGHSLKRGSVQLLRTLGLKDLDIIRRIKMEGGRAYLRYAAAFNEFAPPPVPDFSCIEDMEAHMRECYRRRSMMGNAEQFDRIEEWISQELASALTLI